MVIVQACSALNVAFAPGVFARRGFDVAIDGKRGSWVQSGNQHWGRCYATTNTRASGLARYEMRFRLVKRWTLSRSSEERCTEIENLSRSVTETLDFVAFQRRMSDVEQLGSAHEHVAFALLPTGRAVVLERRMRVRQLVLEGLAKPRVLREPLGLVAELLVHAFERQRALLHHLARGPLACQRRSGVRQLRAQRSELVGELCALGQRLLPLRCGRRGLLVDERLGFLMQSRRQARDEILDRLRQRRRARQRAARSPCARSASRARCTSRRVRPARAIISAWSRT
ncbi:hypothetical protein [Burkholderia sp. Bp8963]|uniref:hypothetical protein n=1 Tax=Burkholderia sp. Bp8963 TaxID=2184547 RepID=UPI000F5AF548|nr:hypothetical protein [Burkholderia sp. Bp8963]